MQINNNHNKHALFALLNDTIYCEFMNLSQLETFIAVAETGSIGNAAKSLGLTQPAVTRQIQSLEKDLGSILLDRRTKPPTLTPSGRIALNYCRTLQRTMQEFRDSVSESSQPEGDFRLGVAFGATEIVLSEPIDLLRSSFPNLKIEVFADWSGELIKKTNSGALDIAVILRAQGVEPPPELNGRQIGSDEIIVVASVNDPLPERASVEDLRDYQWIMNPKGCWYRDLLQDVLSRKNIASHIVIETFGLEYQLSLISRGVGLGFVPKWAVTHSAFKDELKIIRLSDCNLEVTAWTIQACYLGRLGTALETLEDAISEKLK
jgi:DNA-binding transcriptional LysR family regulator